MFYKQDSKIRIAEGIVETSEVLEVGNYLLHLDSIGYYLTELPEFSLPVKLYGVWDTDRYIKSFNESKGNMGILFSGIKGGGKTLEAKLLCKKINLPTIVISQAFVGSEFQQFLSSLGQPAVILIDEFEKVYDEEEKQEQLLPIMDGIFDAKLLFLLTTNSLNVSQFIKNRTGRVRYLKQFSGVSAEVVDEIIEDKLENTDEAEELRIVLNLLSTVSIDNLINIIEEMNRFNESAKEAVRHLNVQLEHTVFNVIAFINGRRVQKMVYFNPLLTDVIYFYYEFEKDGRTHHDFYQERVDEMRFSVTDEEFQFVDKHGNELNFIPSYHKVNNFLNLE